jgi:ribosome biogenesis GTPase
LAWRPLATKKQFELHIIIASLYQCVPTSMALPLARLLRLEASVLAGRSLSRSAVPRGWRPAGWCRPDDRLLHSSAPPQHRHPRSRPAATAPDAAAAPPPPPPEPCTTAIGQVMAAQANFVRIKVDRLDGSDAAPPQPRLLCVVRALLKKIKQAVLVGDRVRIVGIDWADARGMVEEVLPRGSELAEPPVANVTQVLLVFSVDRPPLQPSAATRYLVAASAAGLPTTVVLNKVDLLPPDEAAAAVARVRSWGHRAVPVSVVTGEGVAELEAALRDEVTVVAGPSGAGKSSIINALRLRAAGEEGTLASMDAEASGGGGEAEEGGARVGGGGNGGGRGGSHVVAGVELQAVGSVSERIGRGKHTTRNVTLVEMGGGGLLVDTPGFNQPDVLVPPGQLASHFPEVAAAREARGACAFADCQHLSEPGCVVRGDWERYGLYEELHAEMRALDDALAARASGKRAREGTTRAKSRAGGRAGLEARLETKTHRRVSRRFVNQKLSDEVVEWQDVADDDANAGAGAAAGSAASGGLPPAGDSSA